MVSRVVVDNPFLVAIALAVCAMIVYRGRIDLALGVFSAAAFWAYNVDLGPYSLLWVLVVTLFGAMVSDSLRRLHRRDPKRRADHEDIKLVLWLSVWCGWIFLLFFMFPSSTQAKQLINNLVKYDLLIFFCTLLFVSDKRKLQNLAYGFIATSLLSGLGALWLLQTPLALLLQVANFQLRGLSGINYLTFAVPFALSTFFSMASLINAKNPRIRLLMSMASVSSFGLLLLTGARQAIVGAAIGLVVFVVWLSSGNRISKTPIGLTVLGGALVSGVVYSATALGNRWALVGDALVNRGQYWQYGWVRFLGSPIWGNGIDYSGTLNYAHNIILDTLAGQGLVGLVLFAGFLLIILRRTQGSWKVGNDEQLAVWRMGLLCALLYILVSTQFSGTVYASPHLFLVAALIWRMSRVRQDPPEKVTLPNAKTSQSTVVARANSPHF